jgi:hypothetical protein
LGLYITGLLSPIVGWCLGWNHPFLRSVTLALAVLLFLVSTATQTLRIRAKLAFFTIKFGMAILIAAMFRVRMDLVPALRAFAHSTIAIAPWRVLSFVFFWAAPLAFLASNLGWKSNTRKNAALVGLFGIALPLAGVIFVVGWIAQSAAGGGGIGIDKALFSGDAYRYIRPKLMIFAITMFGAIRFGITTLMDAVAISAKHRIAQRATAGGALCVIAALSAKPPDLSAWFDVSTGFLVSAAAVVTASFVLRKWRTRGIRRVDWVGVAALLAGWAIPLLVQPLPSSLYLLTGHVFEPWGGDAQWWHPWLFPCYAVSFCACIFGRTAEAILRRGSTSPAETPVQS